MSDFLARIAEQIDKAAIDAAKKNKDADNARDRRLLKLAARGELERRMREAQQIHTDSGALYFDSVTKKPITPDEVARVDREVVDATDEHIRLSTIYSLAAARLNDLQKQREVWLNLGEYEADQARQRAAETPQQKAARERRDIEQEILAARR